MKKIITLMMISFFISPTIMFAEEYKDYQNHYTLTIPQGWFPITTQEIDEIEKNANQLLPVGSPARVNYITGYKDYKNESGWLLIQEHPVTGSVNFWMENMSPRQIKSSNQNKNYNLIKQGIDDRFNTYSVEAEIINEKETIKAFTIIFPGKDTTTQLNYYIPSKYYKKTLPKIIDSAKSFSYENGYEFQDKKTSDGVTDSVAGGFLGGMSIYLIGAIIVGIIGIFNRKKKDE